MIVRSGLPRLVTYLPVSQTIWLIFFLYRCQWYRYLHFYAVQTLRELLLSPRMTIHLFLCHLGSSIGRLLLLLNFRLILSFICQISRVTTLQTVGCPSIPIIHITSLYEISSDHSRCTSYCVLLLWFSWDTFIWILTGIGLVALNIQTPLHCIRTWKNETNVCGRIEVSVDVQRRPTLNLSKKTVMLTCCAILHHTKPSISAQIVQTYSEIFGIQRGSE